MAYIRLTKHMRETFVRAAMDDVPKIDYNSEAQALVTQYMKPLIPPAIAKILKDPALAPWIISPLYATTPGYLSNFPVLHPNAKSSYYLRNEHPELWAKLEELSEKSWKQSDKIQELKNKLTAAAESVTTRKALADLLPEFEKYLPADTVSTIKTLPAIANVVSDFTKAGWPKKGK